MSHREYLLSYGNAGDFARFQYSDPLSCPRGARLVVRSHRGQEIGVFMRPATEAHSRLLADRFVGQILRPATEGDLHLAERMRQRSQALYGDARRLVAELLLPMEILDVEIMLDGRQAIIHYLRWTECDPRPLMDPLSREYRLLISLHDLALPAADPEPEELANCGQGSCSSGGCGSCKSGNCASCLSHKKMKTPIAGELHRESAMVVGYSTSIVEAPAKVSLL
jgi:hypothetical protein